MALDARLAPDLIGRERELARVDEFLDGVVERPRGLVLVGEAGIGKTTLWREGVHRAGERGFRVLRARPAGAETNLSFSGLHDLFGDASDSIASLAEPQRRALRIALLLESADATTVDPRVLAAAVLSLLRELASENRVLVAIDDLQWLDAPTAATLTFALRRLETEPVGLLGAIRQGATLGFENVERVGIGPLDREGLAAIVQTTLGEQLSRPALRKLEQASGGNPFFALELARALVEHGESLGAGDELPIPADLDDLVKSRVDRLPRMARRPLLALALMSRPSEETLSAVLGPEAVESVSAGIREEIVERRGGMLRFSHPLLRSVVLNLASDRERRELHGRLATIADDAEERARHLALASTTPDPGVADALEAVAKRARDRGAPDAAAELIEHALRLTPPDREEERLHRVVAAADHLSAAGHLDRSISVLEGALEAAAAGNARGRLLLRLSDLLGQTDVEAGMRACRDALHQPELDDEVRGALHLQLAWFLAARQQLALGLEHARRATELAKRSGDRARLAITLGVMGVVECWAGIPSGVERLEAGAALEAELDAAGHSLPWGDRPSVFLARELLHAGSLAEARPLFEAACESAERLDDTYLGMLLFFLGVLELRAGYFALAAVHADRAAESLGQIGRETERSQPLCLAAHVAVLRGDVERARKAAAVAAAAAETAGFPRSTMHAEAIVGFLELSLGEPETAHRHFETAQAALVKLGYEDPYFAWLSFLPYAIEALVALGRHDDAEEWIAWLDARGRRLSRPWAVAAAARCRGLLLAGTGDVMAGLASLSEAVTLSEGLQEPFEHARALLAYGETLRRANDRRAARVALNQALAEFQTLGAKLWETRVRAELARLGGRAQQTGELTRAEKQIADLVAVGKSNQEVARALHLSPKTVEWNLSKIYRKLHVSSRTELAAKLTKSL